MVRRKHVRASSSLNVNFSFRIIVALTKKHIKNGIAIIIRSEDIDYMVKGR